jgi:hypothetical protein
MNRRDFFLKKKNSTDFIEIRKSIRVKSTTNSEKGISERTSSLIQSGMHPIQVQLMSHLQPL